MWGILHRLVMVNFFALLNIPETLMVDIPQLEAHYFDAQRQYHPDRAGASLEALQQGADINAAYTALKDPFTRAVHLLALQGIDPLHEGTGTFATPALLQQAFALREALEEAATPQEVKVLQADCTLRQAEVVASMVEAAQRRNWHELAAGVVMMKFLHSFAADLARTALQEARHA